MDDLFSSPGPPGAAPPVPGAASGATRVFLGWDRPILQAATTRLLAQWKQGRKADLSRVLAVVPGGRAARLLEASLVEEAERLGLALFPPRIVTPGGVPEALLRTEHPIADQTACLLAWVSALRAASPRTLRSIFGNHAALPADAPWRDAYSAASSLLMLHNEVGGLGKSIPAIADRVRAIASEYSAARGDVDRWLAVAELTASAHKRLAEAGLDERYAAIRKAISQRPAPASMEPTPIVLLVGVPEIPAYVASVLRSVPVSTTALIAAPPGLADRFDALGCVLPDAWVDYRLDLPASSMVFTDSPRDQAASVLDALADLGDSLTVDQAVVAVPNTDVAAILAALGGRRDAPPFRDAAGVPAARAAPARLLGALSEFVESRSFVALASLVRHPDVESRLRSQRGATDSNSTEDWLVELDEYAEEHLPTTIPESFDSLEPPPPTSARWMLTELGHLIGEFLDVRSRPLSAWTTAARSLLATLYETPTARAEAVDPRTAECLVVLDEVIAEIEDAPAVLTASLPATACEALAFILSKLDEHSLAPPAVPGAIDLVGWLELPFDPARAVVIAGVNEGHVPAARASNPLLPDRFRAALGFPTPEGGFARDLFLLAQLHQSRQHLKLIVGRRSTNGDPLRPSRLLFACDPEDVPARVLDSLGHTPQTSRSANAAAPPEFPALVLPRSPAAATNAFSPMPRVPVPEITSMAVTGFRSFLRSPYGFLLEHVLNLRERSEVAPELDGGAFGSLIHSVLHDFSSGPVAQSPSGPEIESTLARLLDSRLARTFGSRPSPAVIVQAEHARLRLARFAQEQAKRRAEGWRILHSEWSPSQPARFTCAGRSMRLRGRIDRVDIHDRTGELAILDYKTSSTNKNAEADHRGSNGAWKNLQLPLYRYLAAELTTALGLARDAASLGYVQLGHDESKIGFEPVGWTADDFASADDAAADVVRRVQSGDFFHLGESPPDGDVLGAIAGSEGGTLPPDPNDDGNDSDAESGANDEEDV